MCFRWDSVLSTGIFAEPLFELCFSHYRIWTSHYNGEKIINIKSTIKIGEERHIEKKQNKNKKIYIYIGFKCL